jgi:hypothetical protein
MSDDKTQQPSRPPSHNLQIAIDEAEGQGIYANLALITHSHSEVIIDFSRHLPGLPKAKVHARIILTAYNAKALHRALGENLSKFEAAHGTIPLSGDSDPAKSIGFKS